MTLGLVEVVGGTVESMNKGVESGVVDCCYEETGGGQGAFVIGVAVVFGEGGGEGIESLKVWFTSGFVVSCSL